MTIKSSCHEVKKIGFRLSYRQKNRNFSLDFLTKIPLSSVLTIKNHDTKTTRPI
jgi:hypothetical protein